LHFESKIVGRTSVRPNPAGTDRRASNLQSTTIIEVWGNFIRRFFRKVQVVNYPHLVNALLRVKLDKRILIDYIAVK